MPNKTMDIQQLADFLQRDARDVQKMASRGYLPGQRVSGEWRFHRSEINHWIETQMHAYTEQELTKLESGAGRGVAEQIMISAMLSEATIATPLAAATKRSVLQELVRLAEQSWELYDPDAVLAAVLQREEMDSTALHSGIAIPHPHRPLPNALGDNIIAFGKTVRGIPFGGPSGESDLYFLVLCRDYQIHLKTLARLSRLFLRPGFVDELRSAETPKDAFNLVETCESELS